MEFKAIGYVESEYRQGGEIPEKAKIILDEKYIPALDGVEENEYITVVFVFDGVLGKDVPLKDHPQGKKELPLYGIFALRTPFRPNPIGITTVKLISIDKNVLTVGGLDAFDKTPVLDIKPYVRKFDSAQQNGFQGKNI